MGHAAFGLADEYEDYLGCGVDTNGNNHPAVEPGEHNVTIDSNRATNKWRGDLVVESTSDAADDERQLPQCDLRAAPSEPESSGRSKERITTIATPSVYCRVRALNNPFCAVRERRIREVLQP
jgi:hypothetical protein